MLSEEKGIGDLLREYCEEHPERNYQRKRDGERIPIKGMPGHRVGDSVWVYQRPGRGWVRETGHPSPNCVQAVIVSRYVTLNWIYRNPAYEVLLPDGRVRRVQ